MTSRGRVLVTPRSLTSRGLDQVPELDQLRRDGYELIGAPAGQVPTEDDLIRLLPGCIGWLAGIEPIGEHVLASAPNLRVISRNGAGTDAIDLDAAARAGVRVERAAGANAQSVAELVIALLFCSLRHVVSSASALRVGSWERIMGSEIADRRIGIVGLGEVGRRTAAAFQGLGAEVRGHDPFVSASPVPTVELTELVSTCDVLSLSCPPPADGRPLMDAERLRQVPRGSILINTARAALVDDTAVLAALEGGVLASYAVDVFDEEPPSASLLLRHERVIATPHIGGYTSSSVQRATKMAVENLVSVLEAT